MFECMHADKLVFFLEEFFGLFFLSLGSSSGNLLLAAVMLYDCSSLD